jgi:DNA primase
VSVVDEVRSRLDIVDVVSGYVPLKKAGRSYKATCPFHTEKTPSFVVSPERQTWHCFGACSTGGDAFSFVMRKEDVEFGEALRLLADRTGVDLRPARQGTAEQYEALYRVNQEAASFYQRALASPEGSRASAYLAERGVDEAARTSFKLGFSPSVRNRLKTHLHSLGFDLEHAVEAGLLRREDDGSVRDFFWGRLMFPIQDRRGRVIGFGGRSLDGSEPKYINTAASPVFDKRANLYGLHLAIQPIRDSNTAVVVEGYMDAITAHENGFRNVVACMGTAVTAHQLGELSRLLANPPRGVAAGITLCLDSDAAGQEATLRGLEEAWRSDAGRGPGSARNGVAVNVARSVAGKDPDEAIRTDPEGWRTSITNGQPLLDYLITAYSDRRDLSSGEGKSGLVEDVRPLILAIDNSFEQDRYLTKLGELLTVPAERLRSMMQGPRPMPRGTNRGTNRRAGPARRTREERLDPAQVSNALNAANENGLEENLLTLVLSHEELRDYATGVPEDHFHDSGNRAIFTMWRTALTLDEVHSSMDDHLAGRVDQLKSKPLPPGDHLLKVQDVSQTVRRLHERHLRHMKRLQTEAFARMTPDAPAEELLQLRRTAAEADSRLKQVFTGRP